MTYSNIGKFFTVTGSTFAGLMIVSMWNTKALSIFSVLMILSFSLSVLFVFLGLASDEDYRKYAEINVIPPFVFIIGGILFFIVCLNVGGTIILGQETDVPFHLRFFSITKELLTLFR